ncbi:TIGR03619 family F420-dependent LLM class oxidoreductase [Nocardioides sp. LHD-245]|uniref:TIGR03619 family F420-dependent LLM class oxidoreductase n=1 Tax=Nocardioides sp. LHD-245 TaxID=3051387 RepID=UPI0027E158AD|nr:TIGR03619 family F420-dependent LLM class oxidoreductase [Nocardioides sp. LHD-245]
MKVGVWIPCYRRWVKGPQAKALATAAEALDFGSLWVQDHLVAPLGEAGDEVELQASWLSPDDYGNESFSAVEYFGEENWWLDPYALWGYLAGCTTEVELGSCIIVGPYRDPIVQAKMLGTLDVLSGGRMLYGVGAGHVPGEFEALGRDYSARGRRLDEYLDVMDKLLTNPQFSHQGESVQLGEVLSLIQPVSDPRPPFLIGGGSKAAVRRAVRRGEGWIPAHVAPGELKKGIDYLEEFAAAEGKPVPEITVTLVWGIADPLKGAPSSSRRSFMSIAEATDLLGQYADLGVKRLAIDMPNPNQDILVRQYELLAEAAGQTGALRSSEA